MILGIFTLLFELLFNMWLVNPNDISCEIKLVETLDVSVSWFYWLATVQRRKVVLKFLILLCIHQASCFVLHHVEHTLSSRVVPVNDEVNVVEPVPEEGQYQWRLGSTYVGLTPNLKSPSTKASPGCIQPLLVFYKVTSLMLMLCCIRW
jgi:hypothetical protein